MRWLSWLLNFKILGDVKMPRYTGSNVCSKPVALLPTLASIMVRVFSDRNPVVAEVRLPPPVAPDNWKSIRILV